MSAIGGKADISDGGSKTVYLLEKWNLTFLVLVVGLLSGSWFEAPHKKGGYAPQDGKRPPQTAWGVIAFSMPFDNCAVSVLSGP